MGETGKSNKNRLRVRRVATRSPTAIRNIPVDSSISSSEEAASKRGDAASAPYVGTYRELDRPDDGGIVLLIEQRITESDDAERIIGYLTCRDRASSATAPRLPDADRRQKQRRHPGSGETAGGLARDGAPGRFDGSSREPDESERRVRHERRAGGGKRAWTEAGGRERQHRERLGNRLRLTRPTAYRRARCQRLSLFRQPAHHARRPDGTIYTAS